MNEIISLSIDEHFYKQSEAARQRHGGGRSEFWRRAMAHYLDALDEPLKGRVRGALLVVHDRAKDNTIDALKHSKAVTSHLHSHLGRECLEVLLIDGPAPQVRRMLAALRKDRAVRFVKVVT